MSLTSGLVDSAQDLVEPRGLTLKKRSKCTKLRDWDKKAFDLLSQKESQTIKIKKKIIELTCLKKSGMS